MQAEFLSAFKLAFLFLNLLLQSLCSGRRALGKPDHSERLLILEGEILNRTCYALLALRLISTQVDNSFLLGRRLRNWSLDSSWLLWLKLHIYVELELWLLCGSLLSLRDTLSNRLLLRDLHLRSFLLCTFDSGISYL